MPNQTGTNNASRGIYLPDGTVTIELTAGTQNLVRAGDAADGTSTAIYVAATSGTVKILGTGELTAIAGDGIASGHTRGLATAQDNLIVNGGLLVAKGTGTGTARNTVEGMGTYIDRLVDTTALNCPYLVVGATNIYHTSATPLVFAADTGDAGVLETDSYQWDKDSLTLTLQNYILTPDSTTVFSGIQLPAGATLKLEGTTWFAAERERAWTPMRELPPRYS